MLFSRLSSPLKNKLKKSEKNRKKGLTNEFIFGIIAERSKKARRGLRKFEKTSKKAKKVLDKRK